MSSSSLSSRNSFPIRRSENGNSPTKSEIELRSEDEVRAALQKATCFAFADLVTSVLRLDFWRDDDPSSIFFCKQTFEVVMCYMQMPTKTIRTLRTHLEGEQPLADMAELITVIKCDSAIAEHTPLLVIGTLVSTFVNTGNYDSRYRVLLRHTSSLLGLHWNQVEEVEDTLASTILSHQYRESETALDSNNEIRSSRLAREKTARSKKVKRALMIGAAGGIGGVLIGLTGGLAAPLVAAGAGVFIGSAAAAGIATTAGAAVLGTTFGVAGGTLAGYKMKKRVGEIEEFNVAPLTEGTSLHCALVVSGWIDKDSTPEQSFETQWRHLSMSREMYTLKYESGYLAELGCAMDYLMSVAVSVAIQHTLMETALAGLLTAVAWPVALVSAASVLDNPWNVCCARAKQVGELLAELLLSRSQGKRPISLVGYSLGARVIFHCLSVLCTRDDAHGIVEDVVLLGAPVTAAAKQWEDVCGVIGGRVINGYCESDWLLRFLYRTMSVQPTIAGTSAVIVKNSKNKIVNYNLSHIVKGHMDYSKKLTKILVAVGLPVGPQSEDSSSTDLSQLEHPNEEMAEGLDATSLDEKTLQAHEDVPLDFTAREVKVTDRVAE